MDFDGVGIFGVLLFVIVYGVIAFMAGWRMREDAEAYWRGRVSKEDGDDFF